MSAIPARIQSGASKSPKHLNLCTARCGHGASPHVAKEVVWRAGNRTACRQRHVAMRELVRRAQVSTITCIPRSCGMDASSMETADPPSAHRPQSCIVGTRLHIQAYKTTTHLRICIHMAIHMTDDCGVHLTPLSSLSRPRQTISL